MNQPSPEAMKNLHRLIARILPKYIDELNQKTQQSA